MNEAKKTVYFFDTNVFLRFLVKEDEKSFLACKKCIEMIESGKITAATHTLVLVEIQFVLSSYYRFPKKDIVTALQAICYLPHLTISADVNLPRAIEMYREHSVKWIDCILATCPYVVEEKAWVVSYDRDFERLDVSWKTPSQMSLP